MLLISQCVGRASVRESLFFISDNVSIDLAVTYPLRVDLLTLPRLKRTIGALSLF